MSAIPSAVKTTQSSMSPVSKPAEKPAPPAMKTNSTATTESNMSSVLKPVEKSAPPAMKTTESNMSSVPKPVEKSAPPALKTHSITESSMKSISKPVENSYHQADKKKVIIIGAGVGGLATAARLAKAGLDVTVVEKNNFSGGRCSLIEKDGFRFDRGPSFYLMPEIFEDLFDDLGERVDKWYQLKRCDPNYVVHFDDKETVTLSSNMPKLKSEIERFEGKDGWARFLRFMSEGQTHYEVSIKEVLLKDYPTFLSILKLELVWMALKIHVFDKLHRRARDYFWSERLRRAFTFSSMYLGMSPYRAPATYNLLQYTELAQGIWYPVGGFHRLPRSLEAITKKNGGRVLYSSPVKRIILSDGEKREACGVELENGTRLEADVVISNADLVWTYSNLLPQTKYTQKLENSQLTCSSISFYWSIKRKIPSLVTHQVFLAKEYRESFDIIFDGHSMPHQPSFYVNVPSRIDPSAAPDGKDAMIVLVPIGHLHANNLSKNWEKIISHAREFVLHTMENNILQPGDLKEGERFSDLIESESMNTPHTWEKDLNLFKGSILGLSHNIFQVINFRPHIKHDTIKRMYFVGASTHPGTGVPVVACGSKLTAEKVLKDLNLDIPWDLTVRSNRPITVDPATDPSGRTTMMNKMSKPWLLDLKENHWILNILFLPLILLFKLVTE
ncbi:hypothetical protein PtA15_8A421 [Puccinia triticina]|uniref:Amine oxidase domain-containing protein n=1 Tax=Puccinia triticina TaxID=208348 RepID=A0ABY7CSS4_9BASI|nr:uncharacterized protein PtA15_8A421 [Puccinia triticina]WAQ87517.1 hypothetical protein PtA15_8A421 [Puccinia triticina]